VWGGDTPPHNPLMDAKEDYLIGSSVLFSNIVISLYLPRSVTLVWEGCAVERSAGPKRLPCPSNPDILGSSRDDFENP